jgi:myo-inositol-1(or 4)-monophosphatase
MTDVGGFVEEVAREGGAALMKHFGKLTRVDKKGRRDLVTAADREAEDVVLRRIRAAFPGDLILSEESLPTQKMAPRLWIVDPLDGTTNFLHSIPHFAISIALVRDGTPIAGLIYNPANDEYFTAERGKGAFFNDRRIRVAARKRLADAVVCCALPHHGRGDLALFRREMTAIQDKVAGLRRFGAAALDLAYVAAGRFDAYWERGLSPWDFAAGVLLVREAGGFVTDLSDRERTMEAGDIIAGNEFMHRELLGLIAAA